MSGFLDFLVTNNLDYLIRIELGPKEREICKNTVKTYSASARALHGPAGALYYLLVLARHSRSFMLVCPSLFWMPEA